ncbi:MAG: PIG-L family deacetylase [Oligoflexia bacterium]|nr:PIG-L family deacetylase [Oligoflexia bacterium]
MFKKPSALVVVAHPDDEAIFFGGLILSKKYDWHVICVTDGNADDMGDFRIGQFKKSCKALGAKKAECWGFPDIFEHRLDVHALIEKLLTLKKFNKVFTHGILGEYGHAHHQDVSYATHKVFSKNTSVYSVAYNIQPEIKLTLTADLYKKKQKILWDIYKDEIKRFVNVIPATWSEGFTEVSLKEVEALYNWLTENKSFEPKSLHHYKWLAPYLQGGGGHLKLRPF